MRTIIDQRGQSMVEFALSISILFLFVFGMIGATMWGTGSFFAQEVAHEVAREYAVSNDSARAIATGEEHMSKWASPFISSSSVSVSQNGIMAVATVTATPRMTKLYMFKLPVITKTSEAMLEDYIRNPGNYMQ